LKNLILILAIIALAAAPACNSKETPLPDNASASKKPSTPGKIDLKLNLKKGDAYVYDMNIASTINQTISGEESVGNQTMRFVMTLTIEDVDNAGNLNHAVAYSRVATSMETGRQSMKFDSADAGALPRGMEGVNALVGASFKCVCTPKGALLELEGLDALLDKVVDATLAANPNMPKEELREQMRSQFGESAMKEMLGPIFTTLPEKPVGIGDTWTRKITAVNLYNLTVETEFKAVDRVDGVMYVSAKSALSSGGPDDKGVTVGRVTTKFNGSGSQEGTADLNEATGMAIKSTMKQRLSGILTVSGPDGEMEIPTKIATTITLQVTKAAPK
jgi:hypothetical protein